MLAIFKNNFSLSDYAFIEEINQRFPEKNILENFKLVLEEKPLNRIGLIKEMRKATLRAGWKLRGIPEEDVETLDEHVEDMKVLALTEISGHPQLPKILSIIDVHDDAEPVVGDFTPHDMKKLTKPEKYRLELLALRTVYVSDPAQILLWEEFENPTEFSGRFSNDDDKIQMFSRYKKYLVTHPAVDLSEFDSYCRAIKWKTEEGDKAFQKLIF